MKISTTYTILPVIHFSAPTDAGTVVDTAANDGPPVSRGFVCKGAFSSDTGLFNVACLAGMICCEIGSTSGTLPDTDGCVFAKGGCACDGGNIAGSNDDITATVEFNPTSFDCFAAF